MLKPQNMGKSESILSRMTVGDMSLHELRGANIMRNREYPNTDKLDLSFRGLEFAGEAGELVSKVKKLVRLRLNVPGNSQPGHNQIIADIEDELGDAMATLDLLAMELDIDLARVTREKFNKVSAKLGLKTTL